MECWWGSLTQSIEMMIGGGVGVVLICKTVKPCVYKKGQDLYAHGFTNSMVLQISNPPPPPYKNDDWRGGGGLIVKPCGGLP